MRLLGFLGMFLWVTGITAQIQGGFSYSVDMFGNSYVYFAGVNTTGSILNVYTACIDNDGRGVRNSFSLYPGNSFSIGPQQGWIWMPGERLVVTLDGGRSQEWVFNPSAGGSRGNASFTGDKYKCKVGGCLCRNYQKNGVFDTTCKNCKHPKHD